MELKEALEKQLSFCVTNPGYKCGVYVKNGKKIKRVIDYIKDFELILKNDAIMIVTNRWESFVELKNGSRIRISIASENCRGQRHNGAIIDKDIDYQILSNIIFPKFIPMRNYETEQFEPWENVTKRVFYVWI